MAITYSSNLKFTLIGTGDQAGTWGNTTNTNIGTLIEQSIAGYVSQTVADSAGSPTSLTIADGTSSAARNMLMVLQGALTAARELILPTSTKLYFIHNNTSGGHAVTVKCLGQTGVSVPNGAKVILACNGTDIIEAANYFSGIIFPASATIATLSGTTLGYGSASITNASIASGTVTNLLATTFSGGSASITTVTGTTFGTTGESQIRGASGSIGQLTVTSATITNLNVTSLTTANFPLPTSGTIATLSGTTLGYGSASITTASIASGTITQFTSTSATITNLNVTSLNIANYPLPASGTIANLAGTNLVYSSATLGNVFASGNVGIGTTSPSTKLEVSTNTGTETLKVTQLDTTGATQATVRLSHGSGTQAIYSVGEGYAVTGTTTSAPFVFSTNNTERMRLDASGNLGIGTSSPWEKLSVPFNSAIALGSSTYSFKIQRSSIGELITTFSDTYDASTARVDFTMRSGAPAENTALSILGTGNVGIGTTTPLSKLEVAGTGALTWSVLSNPALTGNVTFNSPAGGSFAVRTQSLNDIYQSGLGIDGTYNGGKSVINLKAFGVYSGGPYSSDLAFYTTNTTTSSEKMRLDSAGNLGLGVTPSAWDAYKAIDLNTGGLSLAGGNQSGSVGVGAYWDNVGGTWKYSLTTSYKPVRIDMFDGAFRFNIASAGGTAGDAITFTQAMTLDTSGNLGIGTSSPQAKLDVAGNAVLSGTSGYKYLYFNLNTESTTVRGAKIGKNYDSTFDLGIWASTHSAGNGAATVFYRDLTTESMRLDSAGNLGLGVTPSAWSNVTGTRVLQIGDYGAYLFGCGSGWSANPFTYLGNNAYHSGGAWRYYSSLPSAQYLQSANQHIWNIAGSGTAGDAISYTQAMTLDASGNLGVGTSSPLTKLDVAGILTVKDGSGAIAGTTIESTNTGNTIIKQYYNGYMAFATNNAEKMRLDNAGNLGLGVTPSAWSNFKAIQVNTAGNGAVAAPYLQLFSNAYYNGSSYIYTETGAATRFDTRPAGNAGFAWYTAPSGTAGDTISFTQAMTLDASGNLGIGTSSPGEKLDVAGNITATLASSVGKIVLRNSNTTSSELHIRPNSGKNGWLSFTEDSVADRWIVGVKNGNGSLFFNTGSVGSNTDRMVLDSSGNLGLGVTPSAYEPYGGNLYLYGALITSAVSGALTTNYNASANNKYLSNGLASQYYQLNGAHVWRTAPSGTAGDTISYTQAMTLDASGNLGIGTTSPAYKLSVSGDVAVLSQNTLRLQNSDNTNAYALQNAGASGGGNAYLSFVQTGVAERMRIDSSGNLGLGVTPSAWGNGVSAQGSGWALSTTGGFDSLALTANARQTAYGNGGQNFVYRGTAACSSYEQANGNHIWRYAPSGTAGDAVSFTQAMTLANSGNLALGTTSTAYRLTVNYTAPSSFTNAASDFVQMWQAGGTNALGVALSTGDTYARFVTNAGYKFAWNSASTQIMTLSEGGALATVGTMDATSFRDASDTAYYLDPANTGTSLNVAGSILASGNVTAYSDIRVKDNVESITGAIEKISQIRGVTYTRTDLEDKERKYAGVIAQEIEQVLPEAVFDNGKVKAVDYNATIALLIEAVKEQQKRIDKLETLLNKGN